MSDTASKEGGSVAPRLVETVATCFESPWGRALLMEILCEVTREGRTARAG
jgi:hypothetical protein